jgi:hypothetical protein
VSDLIGAKDGAASGITGIAHIARQDFNAGSANEQSYNDYKLGLQKSFNEGALNGVNVGGYWTYANTKLMQHGHMLDEILVMHWYSICTKNVLKVIVKIRA